MLPSRLASSNACAGKHGVRTAPFKAKESSTILSREESSGGLCSPFPLWSIVGWSAGIRRSRRALGGPRDGQDRLRSLSRIPTKKSAKSISRISVICRKVFRVMLIRPRSRRLMCVRCKPQESANASCEIHFAVRSSLTRFPTRFLKSDSLCLFHEAQEKAFIARLPVR